MIHHITRVTRHFLIISVIVVALGVTAVRFSLLLVEDYKADLVSKITELTSIPIKVGRLKANMRGFSPEIILQDIEVLAVDEQGKPSIQLEEVRVGIDLVEMILTRQVLSSSWLTLVGVELSIIRKKNGQISIVGLNSDDSEQPLWLLEGRKYEVLKSKITWLDQQKNKPPRIFDNVDFLIKNDRDEQTHEVHFISYLPKKYGNKIRISLSLQGNVLETDHLSGLVYLEGNDVLLAEFLTENELLEINLVKGNSDFKIWSYWEKSKLTRLSGLFSGKNIIFKKNKQRYHAEQLEFEFNLARENKVWLLGVEKLALTSNKIQWPIAKFSVAVDEKVNTVTGFVEQLDLNQAVDLIKFFAPRNQQIYQLAPETALKGILKSFAFYYSKDRNAYAVNGIFQNLYAKNSSGYPQFENLTGSIKGTEKSGKLALTTLSGSLFLPKLFKRAFPIDKLEGIVVWQQLNDKLQLSSERLVLDSRGFQTETRVNVSIPKNEDSVFLDLRTSLSNLQDISQVKQYYPSNIKDQGLVDWLDNAFISGKIKQGNVLIYGALDQMPFVNGHGVLEAILNIENVELKIAEGWPHLQKLNAEVRFLKESVAVDIDYADVGKFFVRKALVEIPSFQLSQYILVNGKAGGEILEGLRFMQKTPLHDLFDGFLSVITPAGSTEIDLALKIPLVDNIPEIVEGLANLKQANLKIKAIGLNISNVSGNLNFTQDGLFSKKITAKALGSPIAIKVEDTAFETKVHVDGKTNVQQLSKQFEFLQTDLFVDRIKGNLRYGLTLNIPESLNNSAKLEIVTNMKGVEIVLPELLKKSAEQEKLLSISMVFDQHKLLPIQLNYDDLLKTNLYIDSQNQSLYSADVVYGLGEPVFRKNKGVAYSVRQDDYDLTQWIPIIKGNVDNKSQTQSQVKTVNFDVKHLQWNSKDYGALKIAMQSVDEKWQGNLVCTIAEGGFSIPLDLSENNNKKLKLKMRKINLSRLMGIEFNNSNNSSISLPLMSVFSDQLWWKNESLGVLKVETERSAEGIKFKQINLKSSAHELDMTASWVNKYQQNYTHLQGQLTSPDIGNSLAILGVDSDIDEAAANIEFSGNWQGAPYQFSIDKVEAKVNVDLKKGRISSIEPGFGRILGLIAIEQWLKRLTLDFGDIYKQGLTLNAVTGDFDILKGKAVTDNLLINSVPAKITITGEADLIAQTLNQKIRVIPKSSDALPIAGTIVSTVAGTITQFLTDDYQEGYFFGSIYKVTGSWDDIKVTALHQQDGILKKTWTGLTDFSWMKSK